MGRISWRSIFRTLAFCAVLTACCQPALAGSELLRGGTYFLPVYSHIYIGDRARPFLLRGRPYSPNTTFMASFVPSSVWRGKQVHAKTYRLNMLLTVNG